MGPTEAEDQWAETKGSSFARVRDLEDWVSGGKGREEMAQYRNKSKICEA